MLIAVMRESVNSFPDKPSKAGGFAGDRAHLCSWIDASNQINEANGTPKCHNYIAKTSTSKDQNSQSFIHSFMPYHPYS